MSRGTARVANVEPGCAEWGTVRGMDTGQDKDAGGLERRPTSKDVARLAGVSHTAVSFVFNGRAEGNLSAATQERIREAARQLGYRPNPMARGLRRRRSAVIGLVTDHIASSPSPERCCAAPWRPPGTVSTSS